MDPILTEIYKTVLGAAPYVLGAYFLLWLGLMVYIFIGIRKVTGLEKQIEILEEAISNRSA